MSQLAARTAVIVDDHPLWLDALQALLERLEVTVVGRASGNETAERLLREHAPDILIADSSTLEGRDGIPDVDNALACALRANAGVKCIVLSDDDDQLARERTFAAGAAVFCVKSAEPEDVAVAIRQAFDHSIYFPAEARSVSPQVASHTPRASDEQLGLTKREVEILLLTAEGHSNSQLARLLWVTEQTVKFHLSNIYRKLDVANRTEASRWAQRNGLLATVEAA
jgi:DNA-binding NarL/FixJ family response regulator